jgi:hypothetical protein
MRDTETIDSELRLLSRAWRVARQLGCTPTTAHIDGLLDERRELTELGYNPPRQFSQFPM